jgi:16S rRNA (uracil1498-N3)-methyltransferase
MHRFFVPPDTLADGRTVELDDALAHQMARVLRLRPDELVVLLDDSGDEWLVRLTGVSPQRVSGAIEQRRPGRGEPRLRLTLYQAPLKGDQMSHVLQKGVEVGVSAFVPVLTERTIARGVDERKLVRWRQIIREAAEQSGRAQLPRLQPAVALADIVPAAAPCLVLWEGETGRGLAAALAGLGRPLLSLGLVVGPEGGLAPAEVARLAAAGAPSVTLGPRILRAETAGLVAAAVVLYAAGDLGGLDH